MSALNRREALLAAGAAGLGAAFGLRSALSPRDAAAASCLLQREVTEGPYYLDLDLVRRNMKVFVSGDEVHTGQVFFRRAATRAVYGQGRYAARGQAEMTNREDTIYREAGSRALLDLHRKGSRISAGYRGSLTIGVNPSGGR